MQMNPVREKMSLAGVCIRLNAYGCFCCASKDKGLRWASRSPNNSKRKTLRTFRIGK
jgi:hypothetical protein